MRKRTTIVVIEDDPEQRELICSSLVEEGFYTLGLPDGVTLLTRLRSGHVDDLLLILDLILPPPDGWQILDELRREARLQEVPVIVVSGAADQARILGQIGLAGFLEKPFAMEQLLA